MNRAQALVQATKIANLLLEGSRRVRQTSPNNQPLMGILSIMIACHNENVDTLDPSLKEIILFGSAAEDGGTPGDIDLMIFDQGFYSNVFLTEPTATSYGHYGEVGNNLHKLLSGWFDFGGNALEIRDALHVDLLVLPLAVFTDPERRQEIADQQYDPEFFRNAFSKMLRFDTEKKQFVPTDLSYFEQKYSVDLSELRKSTEVSTEVMD